MSNIKIKINKSFQNYHDIIDNDNDNDNDNNNNNDKSYESSNNKNNIVISKETILRLAKDIKQIIKEPLNNNGIYYKHDDQNILKGYALIIGQENTPYAYGNYLFEFEFPYNYPHSPPIVTFLLSDGQTRFNPNLYINGKVCLSILNTWKGDQWTGCQTISTILLVLTTVLTENPLLNEPGIYESHKDCSFYKRIIAYKNIELSIIKLLNNKSNINLKSKYVKPFYDIIVNNFIENYNNIIKIINNEKNSIPETNLLYIISTSLYNMSFKLEYDKLIKDMNLLKINIINLRDNIKIELNN